MKTNTPAPRLTLQAPPQATQAAADAIAARIIGGGFTQQAADGTWLVFSCRELEELTPAKPAKPSPAKRKPARPPAMKTPQYTPAPLTRVTTYKGQGITRLFPSGYLEIYSTQKGRFMKFDTLAAAKQAIRDDLK